MYYVLYNYPHNKYRWSPEEIYSVIMNVGDYKEFIPYCIQSDVHTQTTTQRHDIMEAELLVSEIDTHNILSQAS